MGVGIARGADAYRSADRVAFDRNPVGVARDAPLAVGDHGEENALTFGIQRNFLRSGGGQQDRFPRECLVNGDFLFVAGRFHGDFRVADIVGRIACRGDGQQALFGGQRHPIVRTAHLPVGGRGYRDGGRSAFLGERDTTSREDDHIRDLLFVLVVAAA